jgi:hypothetical protein
MSAESEKTPEQEAATYAELKEKFLGVLPEDGKMGGVDLVTDSDPVHLWRLPGLRAEDRSRDMLMFERGIEVYYIDPDSGEFRDLGTSKPVPEKAAEYLEAFKQHGTQPHVDRGPSGDFPIML